MDSFIVSARKYRPRHFDDVIGQQAIANTLKRAIVNHKLAGAYLFCGPRGVGKTTCARIFAKAINCLNPRQDGEACDECESCKSFDDGRSVNVQELNAAANNSVEEIRAIIDQVRIPPQLGNYKVIILDEVHMLSTSASNALLKTLEEPPSYVIFILATTEKQKILPTILSRCQIFDFNRMEIENIIMELKMEAEKEGIEYDDAALNLIAQKADGGMRDALSIFDQVTSFSGGKITHENVSLCLNVLDYDYYFRMTDYMLQHDVSNAMLLFNEVVTKGFNGFVFISGLASHFRDLLMSKHEETSMLLDVSHDIRSRYVEQAQKCPAPFLYKAMSMCDRCGNEYKTSYNKRLSVEITLIEVSQIGTENESDDVGSGRRPERQLKPIFKATNKPVQPTAKQVSQPKESGLAKKNDEESPTSPARAEEAPKAYETKKTVLKSIKVDSSLILKQADSILINQISGTAKAQPSEVNQENEISNSEQQLAETGTETKDAGENYEEQIGTDTYTDTELNMFWITFSENLPREQRDIQGRMQGMVLHSDGVGNVTIAVNSKEVSKLMKPIVPDVEAYLQKKLNNRQIRVSFVIKPDEEQKVTYTPQQLYKQMLKENSALKALNNQLGLKID